MKLSSEKLSLAKLLGLMSRKGENELPPELQFPNTSPTIPPFSETPPRPQGEKEVVIARFIDVLLGIDNTIDATAEDFEVTGKIMNSLISDVGQMDRDELMFLARRLAANVIRQHPFGHCAVRRSVAFVHLIRLVTAIVRESKQFGDEEKLYLLRQTLDLLRRFPSDKPKESAEGAVPRWWLDTNASYIIEAAVKELTGGDFLSVPGVADIVKEIAVPYAMSSTVAGSTSNGVRQVLLKALLEWVNAGLADEEKVIPLVNEYGNDSIKVSLAAQGHPSFGYYLNRYLQEVKKTLREIEEASYPDAMTIRRALSILAALSDDVCRKSISAAPSGLADVVQGLIRQAAEVGIGGIRRDESHENEWRYRLFFYRLPEIAIRSGCVDAIESVWDVLYDISTKREANREEVEQVGIRIMHEMMDELVRDEVVPSRLSEKTIREMGWVWDRTLETMLVGAENAEGVYWWDRSSLKDLTHILVVAESIPHRATYLTERLLFPPAKVWTVPLRTVSERMMAERTPCPYVLTASFLHAVRLIKILMQTEGGADVMRDFLSDVVEQSIQTTTREFNPIALSVALGVVADGLYKRLGFIDTNGWDEVVEAGQYVALYLSHPQYAARTKHSLAAIALVTERYLHYLNTRENGS